MITVKVLVKRTGRPAKGQKVTLNFYGGQGTLEQLTDHHGEAHFAAQPGSGKVLVNGVERRNCYIDWYSEVVVWSTV